MSFHPIFHTEGFTYTLGKPNSKNDEVPLTIEWEGRKVQLKCALEYLGETPLFSLAPWQVANQCTISLHPKVTAHIDINRQTSQLAQELLGYIQLEQELASWIDQKGITEEEKAGRTEASSRIIQCINHKSKNLDLGYLRLTSLPDKIGNLIELRELNLIGNKLTSLPPSITQLRNLKNLILADNNLTSLPADFGNLVQLTDLNLFSNRLSDLPPSFTQLVNLVCLNLGDNQLKELPNHFDNLAELQTVLICENQFQRVPSLIADLPKLRTLDIRHNPLRKLPDWAVLLSPDLTIRLVSHYFDRNTKNLLTQAIHNQFDNTPVFEVFPPTERDIPKPEKKRSTKSEPS